MASEIYFGCDECGEAILVIPPDTIHINLSAVELKGGMLREYKCDKGHANERYWVK